MSTYTYALLTRAGFQLTKPVNPLLPEEYYLWTKRVFDLLLVLSTAIFWLPVMVLCAVLIKLDSWGGPAMFVQQRTGKGGKRFSMFKFRTMVPDAEAKKQELMHLNELKWPDFKITNDPRITRVGKFLRKTSLDELPQLLNVLKGDMSLVGPRPTSFGPQTYTLWQTQRLDVTPGITGLWQIIGRGSTEFDERLRLDIAYIERRCLTFDLEILIRTVPVFMTQKGAR